MLIPESVYGLTMRVVRGEPDSAWGAHEATVDIEVRFGALPSWIDSAITSAEDIRVDVLPEEGDAPVVRIRRLPEWQHFHLAYLDGTEFVVDYTGQQVWTTWPETFVLEDAVVYLLGPVLGFALHLRRVICLHASAIAVDGQAILLVGIGGAGKSTTAAAFVGQGYAVLTEDVAALDEGDDRFRVRSGYPRIRLWPESVAALYGAPDALPLLTPNWEKRYLDLSASGFHPKPLPVAAVYVLTERRAGLVAPWIEPLAPQAAVMALLSNTYTAHIHDLQMRVREFQTLGRLARTVPVRQVIAPADRQRIPQLCDAILADLGRHPANS